MGSWIFRVHSNWTEGVKMAKERICRLDGWFVYAGAEKEGEAEEVETETSVSREREEFSRCKEPHLQKGGSERQHGARYMSGTCQ